MTAGAVRWAWANSRASNGSLIVMLAIADECGEGEFTEMSIAALTRKCRLSDRAVRMAVKELEALGELSVEPHKGLLSRYAPRQNLPDHPGKICTPAKSADRQNLPDLPREPQVKGTPAKSAGPQISNVFSSTTGSQVAEVKEVPAKLPRPDVDRLCEHLAGRIEANGSRRPNITRKWRDACRLMIDNDGRTEEQIRKAIDWSQDHEFWRANVLSMPKLREKYDQLRLEATRKQNGTGRKTTTNDRVQQAIEAGKRVQAMLDGES
jgi:hypothetical protein